MIYYFLSDLSIWITNFGVVPLLLFLAFLFLPIFTFLLDRINFVILVFDTIKKLRNINNRTYLSSLEVTFLPSYPLAVKAILLLASLCCTESFANNDITIQKSTVLLSIGEHRELPYQEIQKYTVTNPSIIGHKHKRKVNKIIIKGLKLGFTEVVIWTKNLKSIFQIYVLEKRRQLKILHVAETLKEIGLKIKLAGPLIIASGEVKELKDYIYLKQLELEKNKSLILKIKIEKKLRNRLFFAVYERFFNNYEDHIVCHSKYTDIVCKFPKHIKKSFYEDLEKKYSITFLPIQSKKQKQNYRLKINFYKLVTTLSHEFDKGLSKLSSDVTSLLDKNWESLVNQNKFLLEGSNYFLKIIGSHELKLILQKNSKLILGQETPFNNIRGNSKISSVQWKFSGFKIDCYLDSLGHQFQLNYKSEFSKSQSNTKGSHASIKNESSIFLELSIPQNIFVSSRTQLGKEEQVLPYFSKVSFLGELFKSRKNITLSERIIAYVKLEREEN